MQTLGYNAQECKEFFIDCIDTLRHFRKIQESTCNNWKKWISTICKKFDNNPKIDIEGLPGKYFCIELLNNPEDFQNIMQYTETEAHGHYGGLSNTTIANYMQMLTFIMMNIDLCTDNDDIREYPAFSKKNIKRWTMAWGALNIDATNSRHWEYTQNIIKAKADWGKVIETTQQDFKDHPNDIHYVNRYLLALTYDTLCARNDYNECRIYFRGDIIPTDKINTTNYIDLNTYTIHVNDTKNQYEIGVHQYKTYQELSEEYLYVLAQSLKLFPRSYLFMNPQGGIIQEHKFGDYIKKMLGDIYTKEVQKRVTNEDGSVSMQTTSIPLISGCDIIRHLFAQYYYRISRQNQQSTGHDVEGETKAVQTFLNSIEKMLHSQSTHMTNYITPYLEQHGTNIKILDDITRKYHVTPHETRVFSTRDKEFAKVQYYAARYNVRMDKYGTDFEDIFNRELFGLVKIDRQPAHSLSKEQIVEYIKSKHYDEDNIVKTAIERYMEPEHPIPLDEQIDTGLDFSDHNFYAIRAQQRREEHRNDYSQPFRNNTTNEIITPHTYANIMANPDTARTENPIPDTSESGHRYPTRTQTSRLTGRPPPQKPARYRGPTGYGIHKMKMNNPFIRLRTKR